jgi:hypothetical protein
MELYSITGKHTIKGTTAAPERERGGERDREIVGGEKER